MTLIRLKYPPDYDGELHVTVVPNEEDCFDISFKFSRKENENEEQALFRAAQEIILSYNLTSSRRSTLASRLRFRRKVARRCTRKRYEL